MRCARLVEGFFQALAVEAPPIHTVERMPTFGSIELLRWHNKSHRQLGSLSRPAGPPKVCQMMRHIAGCSAKIWPVGRTRQADLGTEDYSPHHSLCLRCDMMILITVNGFLKLNW